MLHSSTNTQRTLAELADCLLLAGRLMMQNGAHSRRTQSTLLKMATNLGYPSAHIAIAYDHIVLTLCDHAVTTARIQPLSDLGVNFKVVSHVTQLAHELESRAYTIQALQEKLACIAGQPHPVPRWLLPVLAGIGCACVGQIFGADTGASLVDFLAGFAGCLSLFIFARPSISPYFTTIIAAAISASTVHGLSLLNMTQTPEIALSASVLYLVPGVPMVSGLLDILLGQIPCGLARLTNMLFSCIAIALGILLSSLIF